MTSAIAALLRDIKQSDYRLLSRDEERKLLRQCKRELANKRLKHRPAYDRLIGSNIYLVINCAKNKRYRNCRIPLEDRIEYGVIGLAIAIRRFQLSRKVKLSTYAVPWIHCKIREAIKNTGTLIHIPTYLTEAPYGRQHDPEKVAARDRALRHMTEVDDSMVPIADTVLELDEAEERKRLLALAYSLLRKLPRRWADILRAHAQGHTLHDIGRDIGLTRERVRQLETKALQRIRLEIMRQQGHTPPAPHHTRRP